MKKVVSLLCLACFIVLISNSSLMAGVVDNRSNLSGEYIRSLNRNAVTDSLDAIAYNPAGVMKMEDGSYADFSVHYVGKDYTNIVNGVALEQDEPSYIPALFALYKRDKWAGFFGFTIPAGGGTVEYNSGNATTRVAGTALTNQLNLNYAPVFQAIFGSPGIAYDSVTGERVEASSVYYGYTVGGAYEVDDNISFSMGIRYIHAVKEATASLSVVPSAIGAALPSPYTAVARNVALDYEETANGLGVIFGMNIDYEPFNIGVKYESETDLDFEYEVNADSITGLPAGLGYTMGIVNGREHARNLPAVLAVGVGYKMTPMFRMDVNITSYFQEDADWGGTENYVTDGWEAGIAFEYMPNPDLKLSIGYLYTETGIDVSRVLNEAPELDARTIGAGLSYNVNENMKMDFGIGVVDYKSGSYVDYSAGTPLSIGFEKDVIFISAGLQYRF